MLRSSLAPTTSESALVASLLAADALAQRRRARSGARACAGSERASGSPPTTAPLAG
ncbi:hypothetical protein [Patulibacter medicamentivorans]|uniref:hypothetical protein n=1 Tax=Patulibacter medicamentivorans TaxID=1097667 RepID=UPI0002EC1F56|nr:hypothetical protein [Patulibacter medicamentivorans]